MSTPIKMPQLGESVVEGTVARWLKKQGDAVEKLEPLLEVSTDKIDTEIPAPVGGILLEITAEEGKVVDAGTIIGYIGEPGDTVPHEAPSQKAVDLPDALPSDSVAISESLASGKSLQDKPAGRNFISPVVGRIAAEHNVDVDQIAGTGLGGRVTKKDLLAFIASRQAQPQVHQAELSAPVGAALSKGTAPLGQPITEEPIAEEPITEEPITEDEILHPLTTMRRAIAQHMVASKAQSPHVTTIFEVDMSRVVAHREANKAAYAERGIALNFTAYFVFATAAALRAEPIVNSHFTDQGIVESRRIHVGVAVALDEGLVVPVLRDADELNLQGVARGVQALSSKARAGQLTADALQGGTFTVSNHGVGGSLIGTPIINQPQAGILGVGAIVKRPVVQSDSASLLPSAADAILIRPMCYLSLTFDHRVFDGAVADRFMRLVKSTIEKWPM